MTTPTGTQPTPPGQRVGALKYQPLHGFTRGQPVYRQASGSYALSTTTTGFDGVVGNVTDATRFEVVSSGEIDQLPFAVPGTLYLSGSPGVLASTGTIPVLKASGINKATVVQGGVAVAAAAASTQTFSLTGKAGAAPLGTVANVLDISWIPTTALETLILAAIPLSHQYVRAPEYGGVLDTDPVIGGSLVFDIDSVTQVIDGDNFPL